MMKQNLKVQYLIAFSVSLISCTAGLYMTWPASVIPKFHNNQTNFQVSDTDISWIVAAQSPGYILGSLIMRHTSDRFGRRFTILASIVPFALGAIIPVIATTAWPLYVTRLMWGIGGGIIDPISCVYIVEIADKEIRGSTNLLSRFMMTFGNFLTLAIGPFLSYSTLNYILLTCPIICFLACWWIPESPYYYLKKGKVNDARKVLVRTQGNKDEKVLKEELSQMKSHVENEMRRSGSASELFIGKQYRKAIFIGIGLKLTQILSGLFVIQHYVGLIVEESQLNLNVATVLIIFGGLKFVACMVSSFVVDSIGRRPLLIYTYLGTGIFLGLACLYFLLLDVIHLDPKVLKSYGFVPFTGIIISSAISTLGFGSVVNFMPAELFPLNVKAVAIMLLNIFGGLLNFTIQRGYQIIKDLVGLSGVFGVYTAACIAGTIISLLLVPEIKGKSLQEIQILLQGDLYEANLKVKDLKQTVREHINNMPKPTEVQVLLIEDRNKETVESA